MMDFDRHCAENIAQTAQPTRYIGGADLRRPVPTCPGRNVSQLMRHVEVKFLQDPGDERS
jgi:hypothetical protein